MSNQIPTTSPSYGEPSYNGENPFNLEAIDAFNAAYPSNAESSSSSEPAEIAETMAAQIHAFYADEDIYNGKIKKEAGIAENNEGENPDDDGPDDAGDGAGAQPVEEDIKDPFDEYEGPIIVKNDEEEDDDKIIQFPISAQAGPDQDVAEAA